MASSNAVRHAIARSTGALTDDRLKAILDALQSVMDGSPRYCIRLRVREAKPKVGRRWREQVASMLTGDGITNQGAREAQIGPEHPVVDGLHFTNQWEHRVYVVLRSKETSLPPTETIGIFPLPGGRVLGHTVEPDILVTYRGRTGVIEIDGPHHDGRHARHRAGALAAFGRSRPHRPHRCPRHD
jgi:hypothetical protein